ncbi:MAG: ParB/RepB/Spo0J family partition protein [Proteobacteria bacterium]|nr:ParB/RepB/Spo0J family partition protein [Pseudomonadota bacterium]MBU4469218.1 ParB/RepB/Spo0J family partition protein [Pseudomonadota bacterium]MCG2752249.1 ParB/RepB/Spo0J family partition protein [Desulfobacteraceae bacterium]
MSEKGLKNEKKPKMALGKGLEALIPRIGSYGDPASEDYFDCDINRIFPNRYQPRQRFSETELAELSESIKQQGIIQPLVVRNTESGYELIAGERRLRAAKMAGLAKVPVIIKEVSDENLLEFSIIENIQREDLNAIEEADAYHQLMMRFDMTQEQVADRVGKSRPTVANLLRLRNLPDNIKESLVEGAISMGHARALLGAKNSHQQMTAWKMVTAKKLSVRETEALIDRMKTDKKERPSERPDSDSIYFTSLAEDLSRMFGTKVRFQRSGKHGKVIFEYYGNDDLDRLLGIWKK